MALGATLFSGDANAQERYTVAPGDTLGAIASRYHVSVADLRRWNRLQGDHLRINQVLLIYGRSAAGSRVRETYTVRSGDTGLAIARRHRANLAELQQWNPRVNLDRLSIGQRLTVYVTLEGSGPIGSPNRGRLAQGTQLANSLGLRVRAPERAWGTPITVSALKNGLARVQTHFADTATIEIADLSFRDGGRIRGHASHQNGRDADVAYYQLSGDSVFPLRKIGGDELDVQRQWYLFQGWLAQSIVEYIFMDYDLQERLYEYVAARGASEAQLQEWFQYPRRGSRVGIIRHEPGHDTHFHVRFVEE